MVFGNPATLPDWTAWAFSNIHLFKAVFIAPEEKVCPCQRFWTPRHLFSCWNAGQKHAKESYLNNERLLKSALWKPWHLLPHLCSQETSAWIHSNRWNLGSRAEKVLSLQCQPGEPPPFIITAIFRQAKSTSDLISSLGGTSA